MDNNFTEGTLQNFSAMDEVRPDVRTGGEHQYWFHTPLGLIFLAACVCTNVTTLLCVFGCRTYRSPANYLLANLCFVSIIFIGNTFLWYLERKYPVWSKGPWMCAWVAAFHRFSLPLMTLAITALSVDRSQIARNPLKHHSKSSVIFVIILVWLVSIIVTIPRALSSKYYPNAEGVYKCTKIPFMNNRLSQAFYATLNFLIIYIFPALVLIAVMFDERFTSASMTSMLNQLCSLELRKSWKQIQSIASCLTEESRRFCRRTRLMRNSCIFTCIFLFCWLPLGIIQFPFDLTSPDTSLWRWLETPRIIFQYSVIFQACVNPLLVQILSFDVQEFLSSGCFNV